MDKWLAHIAENTPMIAQEAIVVSVPVFPLETFFSILSILFAENVANNAHPIEQRIMVQTAIPKASGVNMSVPSCTPTADVPSPAAIDSNITEPIIDNLIHPIGPPTDTNRESIALNTTMDGPIDVTALLFIAFFICLSLSPSFFPDL